jgi:hypothetical protein
MHCCEEMSSRKWLLAFFAAMVCCRAFGQPTPREPIVPAVRDSRSVPLSDPSGVYTGNVFFSVNGSPPVPQIWRIDLQTHACPECLPGQYFLTGTNFSGAAFDGGLVERGGVSGSVNPDGQAFNFNLFAINCPFLNPSGDIGEASYSGSTWGGSFGETVGLPLLIQDGSITGRISGRDCYGRVLTADVSLQRQTSSVPPACNSVAGSYRAAFRSSAGSTGGGAVAIKQSGCFFGAYLPGIGAALEGVVTGLTSASIRVNDPCGAGVQTGTMTIDGKTITGTYSGVSTGAQGCSPAGPVSGSFTATRN